MNIFINFISNEKLCGSSPSGFINFPSNKTGKLDSKPNSIYIYIYITCWIPMPKNPQKDLKFFSLNSAFYQFKLIPSYTHLQAAT